MDQRSQGTIGRRMDTCALRLRTPPPARAWARCRTEATITPARSHARLSGMSRLRAAAQQAASIGKGGFLSRVIKAEADVAVALPHGSEFAAARMDVDVTRRRAGGQMEVDVLACELRRRPRCLSAGAAQTVP